MHISVQKMATTDEDREAEPLYMDMSILWLMQSGGGKIHRSAGIHVQLICSVHRTQKDQFFDSK